MRFCVLALAVVFRSLNSLWRQRAVPRPAAELEGVRRLHLVRPRISAELFPALRLLLSIPWRVRRCATVCASDADRVSARSRRSRFSIAATRFCSTPDRWPISRGSRGRCTGAGSPRTLRSRFRRSRCGCCSRTSITAFRFPTPITPRSRPVFREACSFARASRTSRTASTSIRSRLG